METAVSRTMGPGNSTIIKTITITTTRVRVTGIIITPDGITGMDGPMIGTTDRMTETTGRMTAMAIRTIVITEDRDRITIQFRMTANSMSG